MPLKTILVHIDDSERCANRLDTAVRLAADVHANLVGLYLVSSPVLAPSVAALLPASVVETRQAEMYEAQLAGEQRFREAARTAGLDRIEWRAPAGEPIRAAVAHGRCADLFVVGQGEAGDPEMPFTQELIAATLMSTGRPLLIIPHIGAPHTLGQNVLVAWDGGREASRAVADSMPILQRAKQVTIIAANESGSADIGSALSRTRLVGWLRDHDVEVHVTTDLGQQSVGESLLSSAADLGSDLIVMGGYGHTRFHELVLGGVTRTILGAMTVPVLMVH